MSIAYRKIIEEPVSLTVVIERVRDDLTISSTRQRDLISAVRKTAELLHRNTCDLLADPNELRVRFGAVHHIQARISKKRLANVKSDLMAAIRLTRKVSQARPRILTRAREWDEFRSGLKQKWQRYTLARLANYCASVGVLPSQVSDTIFDDFRAYVRDHQLSKDPDEIVRITRQTWNGIAARQEAEISRLETPPLKRFITRELSSYPQPFRDDLDAWLMRLSRDSLLDEDGPARPLRPTSIRNVKASVRQFAHALVETGIPAESLTCLADLISPNNYRAGLKHFLGRKNGKTSAGLSNMAGHLVAIARHHVKLVPEQLEPLRAMKARLAVELGGMTDGNKERLRQFQDERNVDLLIGLPRQLLRRAKLSGRQGSREALLVMYAVATDILLCSPMRVGNLANLDVDKHLRWHGQGKEQRLAIYIPGVEVKNGQAIEFDVPKESLRLINIYLSDWRPLLTRRGDALFPMKGGGSRTPGHFSEELKRVIKRETGIVMNVHLFRHLAGMLYLDQRPGEYETVRRLLGHRKLTTTTSFYAPLENSRAVRQYDDAVLAKRRQE